MDPRLDFFLGRVSRRLQRYRFAWLLAGLWCLLAAALMVVSSNERWIEPVLAKWSSARYGGFSTAAMLGAVPVVIAISLWGLTRLAYRDRKWLALRVERKYPGLDHRLITAVSVEPQSTSDFLRRMLVDETVLHAATHDWRKVISNRWMMLAWGVQALAMSAVVAAVLMIVSQRNVVDELRSSLAPFLGMAPTMTVEPGDTEIERGTSVLVTVRYEGDVPSNVSMVYSTAGGGDTRMTMERSLKDPVCAAWLQRVDEDTVYRIESDEVASDEFKLTVFDYPALVRSDALIEPPAYARQPAKTIEDTRRVTVPEGSQLTWLCRLNKPGIQAKLVDEAGEAIELKSDEADRLLCKATLIVNENRKWKLKLVDADGRAAKREELFSAKATANNVPEIKNKGGGDLTVSPLEEVEVGASIREDFGLVKAGIAYQLADGEFVEATLIDGDKVQKKPTPNDSSTQPAAGKNGRRESAVKTPETVVAQKLDLEALKAEPDQLLSYYFWAEDLDREGKVRRVDGEMYFGEVRPFDEIFREGQSPSGPTAPSQSPQAQKADELAELQKKIISGTWNLVRKDFKELPMADIDVLIESQNEALGLTEPLAEELRDPVSKQHLESARKAMKEVVERLTKSKDTTIANELRFKLRETVTVEQQAYERLLKLRAREHQIVKSQPSQSKSQSASQKKKQQQIDQLKLDDDQERYESENEVSTQEQAENREMRQVMNRLDELARRQEDLNRQLKDLETTIQEAKTPEQKKELEEQLKRLRDNQNELLRDSDELLERMQQSQENAQNPEPMRQAQEQVEQARENVQQASQALSESNPSPSQALASGTRAEQQLQETREQLREQSAQKFEESLQSMLNEARDLEAKQKELNKKTLGQETEVEKRASQPSEDQKAGLRSGASGEPAAGEEDRRKTWQEQGERLNRLWDRMEETVAEAEPSEPLLAEKLYESYRSSKQQGLDERMEIVPQLIERGYEEPVRKTLEELEEGVAELRKGIEAATESVLGNEEAGLRRALDELAKAENELTKDLRRGEQTEAVPSKETDQSNLENQTEQSNAKDQTDQSNPSDKSDQKSSKASPGKPTKDGQPSSSPLASESSKEPSSPNVNSAGKPANGEGKSQKGSSPPGPLSPKRGEGKELGSDKSLNEGEAGGSKGVSGGRVERGFEANLEEGPFTGGNFVEWSDRLREVEESIRDPELRASASSIRQAAREALRESKRHAKEPQWDLIKRMVADPLSQLREAVQLELLKRSADRNAVVPIDRDPVPSNFEDQLRQYYENLSSRAHVQ